MRGWGVTLIVIGLGSYVLPLLGLQFRLINLFGEGSGLIFAGFGVILFVIGSIRESAASPAPARPSSAPPPPPIQEPKPSSRFVSANTAMPSAQATDRFRRVEDEYFRLTGQLAVGRMTREQFEAALKNLMIQDAQGRYWMIGAQGGKWFVHDGQRWVEAEPPRSSAPPASPLSEPVQKVKLPSDAWVWDKPDQEDGTVKEMYVKQLGPAVKLRLSTYEVPSSASEFVDEVRSKMIVKPNYVGAEVRLVETKPVEGQEWAAFSIRTKDRFDQEVWARKTDPNVVLMIMYTAANAYFNQYYADFMTLVKEYSR